LDARLTALSTFCDSTIDLKKKACFKHYSSCCVAAETVFFPACRRRKTEKIPAQPHGRFSIGMECARGIHPSGRA
jgi:hypothetical protein